MHIHLFKKRFTVCDCSCLSVLTRNLTCDHCGLDSVAVCNSCNNYSLYSFVRTFSRTRDVFLFVFVFPCGLLWSTVLLLTMQNIHSNRTSCFRCTVELGSTYHCDSDYLSLIPTTTLSMRIAVCYRGNISSPSINGIKTNFTYPWKSVTCYIICLSFDQADPMRSATSTSVPKSEQPWGMENFTHMAVSLNGFHFHLFPFSISIEKGHRLMGNPCENMKEAKPKLF